jgi:NAD(P)-dependent dehydrogenase (short-subunit alcohol dehydrogenase family)
MEVCLLPGSSGIGKAAAVRLMAEGARVVINGRDPGRLAAALHELQPHGAIWGVAADTSRDAEVDHLVAEALVHLGRIDTLVNSAGIDGARASVLDLSSADWRRVLEVNLTGPFLVARAAWACSGPRARTGRAGQRLPRRTTRCLRRPRPGRRRPFVPLSQSWSLGRHAA